MMHSSVKRLTTAHLHQLLRLLMQQRLKLRVQWISNLDTVPNLLFFWIKNLQKRMKLNLRLIWNPLVILSYVRARLFAKGFLQNQEF